MRTLQLFFFLVTILYIVTIQSMRTLWLCSTLWSLCSMVTLVRCVSLSLSTHTLLYGHPICSLYLRLSGSLCRLESRYVMWDDKDSQRVVISHNITGLDRESKGAVSTQRCDRGIHSISGCRSVYRLHFGISQFMRPEAHSWIFVRVQLGWLSNQSLYQTFSVNLSLLYQAVGTQANVAKTPFKLRGQIERIFCRLSSLACVPTAWYKRDGFIENVWYKLRLLSQPSCTRTNIQECASGLMNWLIPKCKQYKFRPSLIL